MTNEENIKRSQAVMQTTQTAETIQFASMFGSNLNPKWFEFLMKYAGMYLFTFALFFAVLKLGINIYQYIKNPNKNINGQSSLLWNIFHTAIIVTAIIGSLVAATIFAIVTPALFVTAMGLDTLRNIGNLLWNVGKLISLRMSLHQQLKDPTDEFTKIKYESLKQEYLDQIKMGAMGSIIGLMLTTAATIIFLFPQIGLGAVATAGIIVAGIKITVGAIVGVGAAVALLSPMVYGFGSFIFSKLFGKKPSSTPSVTNPTEQALLTTEAEGVKEQPDNKPEQKFSINSETSLNKALDHNINFSAFTMHRRFRETIIDHIEDENLARQALLKMVDQKINGLTHDLNQAKDNGYQFFGEQQRPKREQKLHAMLLLKRQLQENSEDIFDNYRGMFKNFDHINKQNFASLDHLIQYIEDNLKGVKISYLLDQSDTQNIIEAVKHYTQKFVKQDLVPSV